MQAAVYDRWGGPEVLKIAEVNVPIPHKGEVLVRVAAASINAWDWDLLTGRRYVVRPSGFSKGPKQLGFDLAGTVEQIGPGASRFQRGDLVMGDLAFDGPKAFSQFVVVREAALAKKPEGLNFVQAAALPQAGLLASLGLRGAPEVRNGSRVLVNGAGGGVGTFAIQLAKRKGAHVTGVDSAPKLETMSKAGADRVIDFAQADFTEAGERYDRILDVIACRPPPDYTAVLAPGGRLTVIGGTTIALLNVATLGTILGILSAKRLGVLLHKRDVVELEHLAALCASGQLSPVVDRVYPLGQIQDAFARFASGQLVGKIVVSMG